jgi:ADP-heptose:LPS heptosyltransferase
VTTLTIRHRWALGDTVLLTGLVRDLHRAFPGKYKVYVDTHWTPIWLNNPHVVGWRRKNGPGLPKTDLRYEIGWGEAITTNSIAKTPAGRVPRHVLAWYHYDFQKKTGIEVPCTEAKPDLHLTPAESRPLLSGRYWVVIAGGKLDMTVKRWEHAKYQELVDRLSTQGLKFVQCGGVQTGHVHPPLDGCLNLLGQTENVRDFFSIVKHAEGVICPVTGPMHIAAAFEKPCVVLAGGREEPWFEAYLDNYGAFGPKCAAVKMPHRFLHTISLLPCCDKQGCWKKRTVAIDREDFTKNRHTLCKDPVISPTADPIAKCMQLIEVDHVYEAVMSYYKEHLLPPISITNPDVKREGPPPIRIPEVEVTPAAHVAPEPKIVRPPSSPVQPQRPRHVQMPPQLLKTGPVGVDYAAMDKAAVGGKFTVCVLCYGPHTEIAKLCINSILSTLPRERMDLRIATNAAAQATVDFVRSIGPDRLYVHKQNDKKYPVMREMFWDEAAPLKTRYLVWFDDDTHVVNSNWAPLLAKAINENHPHGCRLYGAPMYHNLASYHKESNNPLNWFQKAGWWKGTPLRVNGTQRLAPNGSCIDFVPGWFWAVSVDAIRACNIPDPRLNHNGGDITIGAQIHQGGFKVKEFNKGKLLVFTPKKEQGGRRVGGYEESFPWVNPAARFAREFKL